MKRSILIPLIALLTGLGIILIFLSEQEQPYDGPELLFFQSLNAVFVLDDELNAVDIGIDRLGIYYDGRLYCFDDHRNDLTASGYEAIYSVLPDGSDYKQDYRL